MNRREFNKKTLGSVCGIMVMPFLPRISKGVDLPANTKIDKIKIASTFSKSSILDAEIQPIFDNAYGIHLNLTTEWLKDFIKTHPAKHSAEILIEIDGEQKEFTLAEFKAKLGLSGKSV